MRNIIGTVDDGHQDGGSCGERHVGRGEAARPLDREIVEKRDHGNNVEQHDRAAQKTAEAARYTGRPRPTRAPDRRNGRRPSCWPCFAEHP